jgi:tetratricopeptide (TPR) repeat protein
MSKEKITIQKINNALANNNYKLAIENLTFLLQSRPADIELLMARGEAYLRNEDFEKGLTDLAKVVEVDNKNIRALVNFSVALIRCNMQIDAKSVLEYVLELDSKNFDAHINLCNVYQSLGKSEESLKIAIRAIEIRPDSVLAYNNLGTAFGDLNMVKEARDALSIAHSISPTYITTAINLGQIEIKMGNYSDAQLIYEKLLTYENTTNAEKDTVKYYLAYCYLQLGQISKGWDYYEYGFGTLLPVSALRSRRKFRQPQWNGEKLVDKSLLIWCEQGLGDAIEFATCLSDVCESGVSVIFECDARLVSLYKRTFPAFNVRQESIRDNFYPVHEDFDVQCAVGSLPRLFRRNIESFNRNITPVAINVASINEFRNRLLKFKEKKLIGICWRSGIFSVGRNINYTALIDWGELLSQADFQFVNLQYGESEGELVQIEKSLGINILRWDDLDLKNDIENLCGLIKNLDAVVTVGTAVSSIAASCNVPTYLLIRPSWMMLGQKDQYPWYKCVTPLIAENENHIAEKIKMIPQLIRK